MSLSLSRFLVRFSFVALSSWRLLHNDPHFDFFLRTVTTGDNIGNMESVDLRIGLFPYRFLSNRYPSELVFINDIGKFLGSYKGSSGAIRSLEYHSVLPRIAR